ncbi:MAG: AraC family transcriptional regulator [Muribaculaceae bacterium]|nr:AraC family transcriptional regulator [Muribaculaceae bacterium]
MTKELGLKYNLELVEDVSNILAQDFWVYCNFKGSMIPEITDPIKFTSSCSIFVKEGEGKIEIDLLTYDFKGPCIVNIRQGQIIQNAEVSGNFDASFIVLSQRFCDNLFLLLKDSTSYGTATLERVASVPPNLVEKFQKFYAHIRDIFDGSHGPNEYQAMVLAIASFFYECATKCYPPVLDASKKSIHRLTEKFLSLVQQHFKKERFLDFYASQLEVSTKHLSRTVKESTGFTAVEWIDRFVILEAKVLLKATNLSIQQISDELNFASQSFFGKYFKKHIGKSPKDFRNSQ